MKVWFFAFGLLLTSLLQAQPFTIEGYAYESGGRGFLQQVKITVLAENGAIKGETGTNEEGFFSVTVNTPGVYRVRANKALFQPLTKEVNTAEADQYGKVYVKAEMQRQPGYLFDAAISENLEVREGEGKLGIDSVKIEIYNNTTSEEELVIAADADNMFDFTFKQGNHYTILLRKPGYFNRRIEAKVNVDGCILCMEGLNSVQRNISDNLTEGNTMGTLVAYIEMERAILNKTYEIEDIYYDFNKWDIREDARPPLDNVVKLMNENPSIIMELGSHTDSRGNDKYNMDLSQKRAESAVQYIVEVGGISPERIKAQGYGESKLTNKCADGVQCNEDEHQANRRTELRIIGFEEDPQANMSLREIIYEERMAEFINDLGVEEEMIEAATPTVAPSAAVPTEPATQVLEEAPAGSTLTIEMIPDTNATVAPTTTDERSPAPAQAPADATSPDQLRERGSGASITPPPAIPVPADHQPRNALREKGVMAPPAPVAVPTDHQPTKSSRRTTEYVAQAQPDPMPIPEASVSVVVADNLRNGKVKLVAPDFSGYYVEFYTTPAELPESHDIFKRYGDITVDQRKDGSFAYMLGSFSSRESADDFLRAVLAPQYPKASVVEYDQGRMLPK